MFLIDFWTIHGLNKIIYTRENYQSRRNTKYGKNKERKEEKKK